LRALRSVISFRRIISAFVSPGLMTPGGLFVLLRNNSMHYADIPRRKKQQRCGLTKSGTGSCNFPTDSCKFPTGEIIGESKFQFGP